MLELRWFLLMAVVVVIFAAGFGLHRWSYRRQRGSGPDDATGFGLRRWGGRRQHRGGPDRE